MQRNIEKFPETPLGNMIWQAVNEAGEQLLEQVLELEFSVLFANKKQALAFGQMLLENGQKLSFSPYEANKQRPWEITAYPSMPFTVENIMAYQQLLEQHCPAFSGQFDGWYCPELQLGMT